MEENIQKNSFGSKVAHVFKSDGAYKFYASICCILLSLLIGLIILVCMSPEYAFSEFFELLSGGINYRGINGVSAILGQTAPLLCSGLAVVFAYKTGMFNIGVAGQYVMGIYGSLLFALQFNCPWYVCILAAMVFGAIWAAIPGFLKAHFNVNEVIGGIMLNWIALYFANYSFQTYLNGCVDLQKGSKTYQIAYKNPSASIPTLGLDKIFGSYFTIAFFIALIFAILLWFILKKTSLGFALKASGLNRDATKYAGMKEKRNIVISMAISGAMAGLGAALYYLAGLEEWSVQASTSLPGVPWNGIVVAFIGQLSPIGAIFASMFIALLNEGSSYMTQTIFPTEIADLITGVIVYLSGFTNLAVILLKKYVFDRHAVEKSKLGEPKDEPKVELIPEIEVEDKTNEEQVISEPEKVEVNETKKVYTAFDSCEKSLNRKDARFLIREELEKADSSNNSQTDKEKELAKLIASNVANSGSFEANAKVENGTTSNDKKVASKSKNNNVDANKDDFLSRIVFAMSRNAREVKAKDNSKVESKVEKSETTLDIKVSDNKDNKEGK